MTRDELRAAWARFAHRADLESDLDTIEALAKERIRDRMLGYTRPFEDDEDVAESMVIAAGMWLAAGMLEIHRLAQDEAGLAREASFFEGAAANFIMRRSLDEGQKLAIRSDWDGT